MTKSLNNATIETLIEKASSYITDKKIDWAYGYYYNENISKAKQDFNKVLSGGNLANTFDKNKKDKER